MKHGMLAQWGDKGITQRFQEFRQAKILLAEIPYMQDFFTLDAWHAAKSLWQSTNGCSSPDGRIGNSLVASVLTAIRCHQIDRICVPHLTSAVKLSAAQIGGSVRVLPDLPRRSA